MQHRPMRVSVWVASLCAMVMLFATGSALAQQATSPAYGVDEVFFGSGGGGDDYCSAGYCAKQSLGELAQGYSADSANPGDAIHAGQNTNREEYIEFVVTGVSTDLGILSSSTAARTTGNFRVKAYLSSGYIVVNASNPPRNSGSNPHTMTNLTSPTASSPGTEQFGINLVANSGMGTDPVQVPDNTFSFGAAATGYNTANQYKYVKGDTIAQSTRSSGETDYTVTYLFNINDFTPAGQYTFNHNMVAIATY